MELESTRHNEKNLKNREQRLNISTGTVIRYYGYLKLAIMATERYWKNLLKIECQNAKCKNLYK